jgi:hypothetical protein
MTHLHELTVPFHTELRLGGQLDLTPQFAEFAVLLEIIMPQPATTGGGGSDKAKQRTMLTATLLDKQGAERKDQEFIIASFSHDTITHENVSVRFPVLRANGGGYRLRLKLMTAAGNKGAEDAAPFDASVVLHGVQQTMLTATQIKALQQQNAATTKK